jgi:hypothetical protein
VTRDPVRELLAGMAVRLAGRLDEVLGDLSDRIAEPGDARSVEQGIGVAKTMTVVRTEVRRFFADQIIPLGPCLRPRCGHPADWHRVDDATNLGPSDPGVLFRCLGFDVNAPGKPDRTCDCADFVRAPDPRPDGWVGRWPSVCDVCGHRHTPGERCADHTWNDSCRVNAGRYCGRDELIPANVPPCGVVGHIGCTWMMCREDYTTTPGKTGTRVFDFPAGSWSHHGRPTAGVWWGFLDPDDEPRGYEGTRCTIARDGANIVVTFTDGHVIRFGVQRQFRIDPTAGQP